MQVRELTNIIAELCIMRQAMRSAADAGDNTVVNNRTTVLMNPAALREHAEYLKSCVNALTTLIPDTELQLKED